MRIELSKELYSLKYKYKEKKKMFTAVNKKELLGDLLNLGFMIDKVISDYLKSSDYLESKEEL